MAVTTMGVFSKESAVAILGVILLYELTWWEGRKEGRKEGNSLAGFCSGAQPSRLHYW
jgi:hypothetical protein